MQLFYQAVTNVAILQNQCQSSKIWHFDWICWRNSAYINCRKRSAWFAVLVG